MATCNFQEKKRVKKNNVIIPKPKEEIGKRVGASEVKERDASSRGL